ncbi:MAG: hypothetical protein V3W05_03065, partial [candidate division NC10 bacterium]
LHRTGPDVDSQKSLAAALETTQHHKTLSSSIDDVYPLKPFINILTLIISGYTFVKQKMGQLLLGPSLLLKHRL